MIACPRLRQAIASHGDRVRVTEDAGAEGASMETVKVMFLGCERVFAKGDPRVHDCPRCWIASQWAILDQLDGVWNLGFAGLDGEGATPQEAAVALEAKLVELAKVLAPLVEVEG